MGADTEVEQALREIRLRLRAEAETRTAEDGDRSRQTLAQIESDLSITGRAWSRLPPVQSDRRGTAARLELWLKGLLRQATRWFTWEQVNYNAAVNHALRAAHALLSAHEREIQELRAQLERAAADAHELRSLREEVERLKGGAPREVEEAPDGGD